MVKTSFPKEAAAPRLAVWDGPWLPTTPEPNLLLVGVSAGWAGATARQENRGAGIVSLGRAQHSLKAAFAG